MIDYYELLNIKNNASTDEIKAAYRTMVKKYHPDVNKTAEANKIIISLNEAKETLLDPEKRKEYDLLLDEIKHSKQIAKENTYTTKTKEYKETYEETYVTKWQFFINYLKNGKDSYLTKFLKSLLVFLNLIAFTIIKGLSFIVIILLDLFNNGIDYFVGFIALLGILSLFILTNQNKPDYISFLPANIESFIYFSSIALIIELLKELVIKASVNLYVLFQNLEDKIFVTILMK